ncbi:conserved hypothetical protein [Coleofasciculus chthonoplastes PCC 7420]|uniref:GmrSD restriction endonucleases N-terminal domain-containing protein n=1 Tax=Coleofasciculus chthonoplastes PCC 7420 TaxID=118168 RepID=B4W3P8_9CYAN|nr:DUF262 domain-containing protein [Coleofasciculus chthonoplastes]EDX71169.1 conserved hypothetical protein [Coleofasciculus chthonoplastes PCC 7420]
MTDLKNINEEFSEEDTDIDNGNWSEFEEEEIEPEEEETTEPFDPTKIRVDTRSMTIDLVLSRIEHDELDLAPNFQRRAGIWTDAAKSRLIESILIRIPLPAFYMDATNEDKWLVVDGLQRLTALKQFVIDKQLRLIGLEYLNEIENNSYEEIPRKYQRRIQETQITVYLIEKGTPPKVKFNIFKRINTGGLPLSAQEIRHAINQGKATKILSKLAESTEFKRSTSITKKSIIRMEDHEFVLRFLAFMITDYRNYKSKILDDFLNDTMIKLNGMTDDKLSNFEHEFTKSMNAAHEIFGKYAFRKRSQANLKRKYPLNKALFESWSVNLAKISSDNLNILKERKESLNKNFINLMETDEEFMGAISQGTGKVNQVKHRFGTIEKLIKEVLT